MPWAKRGLSTSRTIDDQKPTPPPTRWAYCRRRGSVFDASKTQTTGASDIGLEPRTFTDGHLGPAKQRFHGKRLLPFT